MLGYSDLANWTPKTLNEELEDIIRRLKNLLDSTRLPENFVPEIKMRPDILDLPTRTTEEGAIEAYEDKKHPWVLRPMSSEETEAILRTIDQKHPTKTVDEQINWLYNNGIEKKGDKWYRWFQRDLTQQTGSPDRLLMPVKGNEEVWRSQAEEAVLLLTKQVGNFIDIITGKVNV